MAHMFISMAIYQNSQYDLAKILLADILESRENVCRCQLKFTTVFPKPLKPIIPYS
ncbi:MAG: hypothetical protein ACLU99_06255 [Alphaproteobacteria bacterium]